MNSANQCEDVAANKQHLPSGNNTITAALASCWPDNLPTRNIGGLPRLCAEALAFGKKQSFLANIAAALDRLEPSWPERAAAELAAAAKVGLDEDRQRLAGVLARRPILFPGELIAASEETTNPATRLWLLTALSGTTTPEVRSWWVQELLQRCREETEPLDVARWFAFLLAFRRGWLSWEDYRTCLVAGRVLAAADSGGNYRRALTQLGLSANPIFSRWYRQVVYEVAHQPDVALTHEAGGWMRDFPGSEYFREALSHLTAKPNDWWWLHVLANTSGIAPEEEQVQDWLRACPPIVWCLVSLMRPEMGEVMAHISGHQGHTAAVRWLRDTSPLKPLDLRFLEHQLRPWAEQLGEAMVQACGALCSVVLPADYPGPEAEVLRRRDFARAIVPGFDRIMDNVLCLQALRRESFDVIAQQARRGRSMAVRALCLWPERFPDSAPELLRLRRRGTQAARRAAEEALEVMRAHLGAHDVASLVRRVDLASAWADGGLEGRSARVWWDLAGYRVRLAISAARVVVEVIGPKGRLRTIPKAVRRHDQYTEVRQAKTELSHSYHHFTESFEQAMVEGAVFRGQDFLLLLENAAVRSLVSRLVLLVDDEPILLTGDDPTENIDPLVVGRCHRTPPEEVIGPFARVREAPQIRVAHPLDLMRSGVLSQWQERVIADRIAQPFKQVFREVYLLPTTDVTQTHCDRFRGHALIPRRAYALLRSRGYHPAAGIAHRELEHAGLTAYIQWAGEHQRVGPLLKYGDNAPPVTSGSVWFTDGTGAPLPLNMIPPVLVSETLRDADLLVSRAAMGEFGFTSEETRRLRATLLRYLAKAMSLTTIYVSDDAAHVLVEGTRALYRVHLGSGSALLEASRRHLEMDDSLRLAAGEDQVVGVDLGTQRVLGTVLTLARDDRITDPAFLQQLTPGLV